MKKSLTNFKFYSLFHYESFVNDFVSKHKSSVLYLVYLPMSKDTFDDKFLQKLSRYISILNLSVTTDTFVEVYMLEYLNELFIGVILKSSLETAIFYRFDLLLAKIFKKFKHNENELQYGFAITVSNLLSSPEEIFSYIKTLAVKNYEDNLVRWGWKKLSKLQLFLNGNNPTVVIQPVVHYSKNKRVFSVIGGEAFVGGGNYKNFGELVDSIPNFENADRTYLLIIERTIQESANIPGILKINISPKILVSFFFSHDTVIKFRELVEKYNIKPSNLYIELVEDYHDININALKKVCSFFVQEGFSFSVDDFGVKGQSHEIILSLGKYIREIKLDPISFKFCKIEKTKFLDNLAFIDYCKKLAEHRSAIITAEAVDSYETLKFLINNKVSYFQCNLLSGKLSMDYFKKNFYLMQNLSEEIVFNILKDKTLETVLSQEGNIFKVAEKLGLKKT